jgi:hypothetical protein
MQPDTINQELAADNNDSQANARARAQTVCEHRSHVVAELACGTPLDLRD